MVFIETNFTDYEHHLEERLRALPPTWRARAERYKPFEKRLRSTVGYTMLALILQKLYEEETLPDIQTDEHGKPYFVDYPLYFSISHCKAAVACVVDMVPVAVDVQDMLTDISPALAARIAAPNDAATLSAAELTARWTQKEASAKLDGRGIAIGLEQLPLDGHALTSTMCEAYCLTLAEFQ